MDREKLAKLGYILFFMARGPFITAVLVILIPINLDLMKYNCDSHGKTNFFFFKLEPSAVIIVLNAITSMLIIVASPILGAMSDYRNTRPKLIKQCIVVYSVCMAFCILLMTFKAWWVGAIIQILSVTSFECSYVLVTAYLTEIAKDKKSRSFMSSFSVIAENITLVIFLLILPFFLMHDNPRNLINRGNFDLKNSYKSWSLLQGEEKSPCLPSLSLEKFKSNDDSAFCWRGVELNKGRERTRSKMYVKVPAGQNVTLFQQREVVGKQIGSFQMSVIISTERGQSGQAKLFVKQLKENKDPKPKDVLINKTIDASMEINTKNRFLKKRFVIKDNVKFLKFALELTSPQNETIVAKILKIETVLPMSFYHVRILLYTAAWFSILAVLASLLLSRSTYTREEIPIEEGGLLKNGLKSLINTFSSFNQNVDCFIFLFGNFLSSGGYALFNGIILIYLEDKIDLSPSMLSVVFLFICLSIILGATLNYIMEQKINQWNTALISFALWIFNPLLLYLLGFYSIIWVFTLSIYFGVNLGMYLSLKYSIYSNLIPESKDGEYMGILYFSTKSMDLVGSVLIIGAIEFFDVNSVILLSSALFCASYFSNLHLFLRRAKGIKALEKEERNGEDF